MAEEKLIYVRDEYYRKVDGALRHRRFIAGVEIWDSDALVCFVGVPRGWPWDVWGVSPLTNGSDVRPLVKEAPKSIVKVSQ